MCTFVVKPQRGLFCSLNVVMIEGGDKYRRNYVECICAKEERMYESDNDSDDSYLDYEEYDIDEIDDDDMYSEYDDSKYDDMYEYDSEYDDEYNEDLEDEYAQEYHKKCMDAWYVHYRYFFEKYNDTISMNREHRKKK